jgi:DNA-binding CsgD family transcriptional regulator
MKNTKALSHIRQLCSLGVDSHAVIPAIVTALHELIPSSHNLFIWTDQYGQPVDRYCEIYVKSAVEAAQQNLDGKPDIPAIVTTGKAVGNLRERGSAFYKSGHYNECYKPMRVRNSLDVVIRTAAGPQGILILHRDSNQPFTQYEERELEHILPYLRSVWTMPRNADADEQTITSDHGTIVVDTAGQIQYISTSASQLMRMAQKQGKLSESTDSSSLPAELLSLTKQLICLETPYTHSEPPVLQLSNRWGKFVIRATWLEGMSASDKLLISINIWRQEPLPVSVVRGFRNSPLSPKQRDVALMLVIGRTAEEVVQELSISVTTYKDHLRKIYEKLGISKRSDLIRHLTQPAAIS